MRSMRLRRRRAPDDTPEPTIDSTSSSRRWTTPRSCACAAGSQPSATGASVISARASTRCAPAGRLRRRLTVTAAGVMRAIGPRAEIRPAQIRTRRGARRRDTRAGVDATKYIRAVVDFPPTALHRHTTDHPRLAAERGRRASGDGVCRHYVRARERRARGGRGRLDAPPCLARVPDGRLADALRAGRRTRFRPRPERLLRGPAAGTRVWPRPRAEATSQRG